MHLPFPLALPTRYRWLPRCFCYWWARQQRMIKNNIQWKWQMDLERWMEWNAPSLFPAISTLCFFSVLFLFFLISFSFFPLFSSSVRLFFLHLARSLSRSLVRYAFFLYYTSNFPMYQMGEELYVQRCKNELKLRHTLTHNDRTSNIQPHLLFYIDTYTRTCDAVFVKNKKKMTKNHTFFSKTKKRPTDRTNEERTRREKAPQTFNTIIYHSKQFLRYLIAREHCACVFIAVAVAAVVVARRCRTRCVDKRWPFFFVPTCICEQYFAHLCFVRFGFLLKYFSSFFVDFAFFRIFLFFVAVRFITWLP